MTDRNYVTMTIDEQTLDRMDEMVSDSETINNNRSDFTRRVMNAVYEADADDPLAYLETVTERF